MKQKKGKESRRHAQLGQNKTKKKCFWEKYTNKRKPLSVAEHNFGTKK